MGDMVMVRGQDCRLDAATLSVRNLWTVSVVGTVEYGLVLSWRGNTSDLLVGQT
jgi:hypothetical protein